MPELPLSGVTVIELGHSIAVPYAGFILAQLGAEVIKVEKSGHGDPVRDWGPPYTDKVATAFHTFNRAKVGIAVDLSRRSAARCDVRRLITEKADVVLQNMRAGAAERAGLGSAALRALKPSLIYCNMYAFGADGPLRDRPGYDPLMQAYGGLMSVTGEPGDGPAVRIGVSIVDMGAGMWAVIGILAALAERQRSGRGTVVDLSLYETAIGWMLWPLTAYLASGQVPRRQGSGMSTIVPYQVFRTRDSELMVAAGNDGLFSRLCEALGRPALADRPAFRLQWRAGPPSRRSSAAARGGVCGTFDRRVGRMPGRRRRAGRAASGCRRRCCRGTDPGARHRADGRWAEGAEHRPTAILRRCASGGDGFCAGARG